jgi:hypothetical protein
VELVDPRGVRGPDETRVVYTLLVARFPRGGEAEAEDHRSFLESQGFSPAYLRRTTKGVELCVGRFESQHYALLTDWRHKIAALRDPYASCHVARIPSKE